MMKLLLLLLTISVAGSAFGADYTQTLQTLKTKVEDGGYTLTQSDFEQIAQTATALLLEIPTDGLNARSSELGLLADIREGLEARTGLREMLLALRVHKAVDLILTVELCRSRLDARGISVSPPYQTGSVSTNLLDSTSSDNALPVASYFTYASSLGGTLASYCQANGITAQEFEDGEMLQNASDTIKSTALDLSRMESTEVLTATEMGEELFAEMMRCTDDSRDIRMVFDLYLETGTLPDGIAEVRTALGAKLQTAPQVRILTYQANTGTEAARIMSTYLGTDASHYEYGVAHYLLPFMTQLTGLPEAVVEKFTDFPKGVWLSFAQ